MDFLGATFWWNKRCQSCHCRNFKVYFVFFKKVLFGYVNKAVCVMDLCAKASHCKALLAIYKGYLTLPQKILYCPPSSSDMKDCCWKSFFSRNTKNPHCLRSSSLWEGGNFVSITKWGIVPSMGRKTKKPTSLPKKFLTFLQLFSNQFFSTIFLFL